MAEQPEYLTVTEAAELLRLSEHAISRMLRSGQLPGIFAGRREGWRIRRSDLATWTTNKPPQPKLPKPPKDN